MLKSLSRRLLVGSVLHLKGPSLKLAQRRVLPGYNAVSGYEESNAGTEIAPRGEEDEAVDGFVKASAEQECRDDEDDAEKGEGGGDALGDGEGVEPTGGEWVGRHGEWIALNRTLARCCRQY